MRIPVQAAGFRANLYSLLIYICHSVTSDVGRGLNDTDHDFRPLFDHDSVIDHPAVE